MPFPASPSNNDVHKVGNRAFVYDSALGTWDQVRETDRTENKILSGNIGAGVSIGSGATFPAGHVIKNHHTAFLGVQTVSTGGGNSTTDFSDDVSKWVLIGTGASGGSGDPLLITTGIPSSSSSKYLLRANVTYSRQGGGSNMFKWWYRVAGTGSYVSLVSGQENAVSANWIRYAFGSDHHSSGSNHGSRQGSMEYLWSPGTTNSYDIQIMCFTYAANAYINRPVNTDNTNYMGNAISTFTVQEIA